MESGDPEHELAWEKHKQYCNDDVRALELIYSKMKDASRIDGEVSDSMNVEEETSQGSLFGSY